MLMAIVPLVICSKDLEVFSFYFILFNRETLSAAEAHVSLPLDNTAKCLTDLQHMPLPHTCTGGNSHAHGDNDSFYEMFYNQLIAFQRKVIDKCGQCSVSAKAADNRKTVIKRLYCISLFQTRDWNTCLKQVLQCTLFIIYLFLLLTKN